MNKLQRQILQAIADIHGLDTIYFTSAAEIAQRLHRDPLEIEDNFRLMAEAGLVWVEGSKAGYEAQLLPAGREALRETRWARLASWLDTSGVRAGAQGWFSVNVGKLLAPILRHVDDLRRGRRH